MVHETLSIFYFQIDRAGQEGTSAGKGQNVVCSLGTNRMNKVDSTTPWSKFGKLKHVILFHFPQETESGDLW